MNNNIQNSDQRIKFLLYKIKNNTATQEERKEYIDLMYSNGYITKTEYENYKNQLKKPTTDFAEILVGLGLAVLIGALIGELFKGDKK
ncbi:hypothetical protein NHF50_14440 [Flavobacterium sp. NRK F10]|uniref:hypothetical protein n=1 Tax=Flavobacterium sp. NRK F10 TaxID=2954931 RepID=UPI002091483E|nr:hypothetical protein [Flavobacterium sp. NRK F10]MCO6176246.1 hypothetical protein [Flavobacterium sp. NRK F10]